jgi:membrane protein DedA with SNARE-associated domain
MSDFGQATIAFVQSHSGSAAPLVLLLAFCESFAFVSLLVPATVILFGVGGLIGASGIEFWPIWGAAVAGAVAGDWLAYTLAFRFKDDIAGVWPLSRDPKLLARGLAFFQRWGLLAVFVGRFFGPLRAAVPLAAGVCAMPWIKFQCANVTSALVWATGILAPGAIGMRWLLG